MERDLKRMWLFLFCGFLLCAAGCTSAEDNLYSQVTQDVAANNDADPTYSKTTLTPPYYPELAQSTPVPNDTLSGELLIKGFQEHYNPPAVYWLAREFMELHPNVTITLQFDKGTYDLLSAEEFVMRKAGYYANLRAELAAGEADCLIFAAMEDLDYYGISKSGVLRDIRGNWETDPEIDRDHCFTQVINAFIVDGKLAVMPYSFTIPCVFFNREILDEIGVDTADVFTVNAGDILAWYEQAREIHPELPLFYNGQGKDVLFATEMPRYIDLEHGTVTFDSPEFVRFLERTRAVVNEAPVLVEDTGKNLAGSLYMEATLAYQETGALPVSIQSIEIEAGFSDPANMVREAQKSFAVYQGMDIYDTLSLPQSALDHLVGPFPVTSTDGQLGLSTYYADFIMPSSLKNSDIAWEFIKYCLSDRKYLKFDRYGFTSCNYYDGSTLPINRKNLAAKVEHVLVHGADGVNILGFEQNHFGHTTGEEIVARLEEILSHSPTSLGLYNVDVQDFLDEYYINELTTPEQCAKKIQDRVMIWLNE